MSQYTSTREGYQRFMELALTPSGDVNELVDAATTPGYYQIVNGKRFDRDSFIKDLVEWRSKSTDYKPVVHEFLRDGDQLAARMTGTIAIDGVANQFESLIFAKIDKETGKAEHLIERAVWGPVGAAPVHGVN